MRLVRLVRALLLPPLVLGLVVVVVLVGYSGWQATQAVRELRATATAAALVRQAMSEGDVATARTQLARVESYASRASDRLTGPAWTVSERVGGIGDDVQAVRRASDLLARAARDVGPDLLEYAARVSPSALRTVDGRVDTTVLQTEADSIDEVAGRLQGIAAEAGAVELDGVVPVIRTSVTGLDYTLTRSSALLTDLARAATALPVALGAEEPRRYLLLLTDPTQSRAGDGVPVRYAVLDAADGMVTLGEQGRVEDLDARAPRLRPAARARLGGRTVTSIADVTATPSYPRSARLARRLWQAARPGSPVDGVLTIDTHALADVSAVLTPDGRPAEDRPGGTVPAGRMPALLDGVLAGDGDSAELLQVLAEAVGQGRLRAWSSDPVVQRQLVGGGLAGDVRGQRSGSPVLGVFLNADDAPGLRLTDVQVDRAGCVDDVTRLTLTARVDAPASATRRSVTGDLLVYGPAGGGASTVVELAGVGAPTVRTGTVRDRPTLRIPISLAPGGSTEVRTSLSTAPGQRPRPLLEVGAADPEATTSVAAITCPAR